MWMMSTIIISTKSVNEQYILLRFYLFKNVENMSSFITHATVSNVFVIFLCTFVILITNSAVDLYNAEETTSVLFTRNFTQG